MPHSRIQKPRQLFAALVLSVLALTVLVACIDQTPSLPEPTPTPTAPPPTSTPNAIGLGVNDIENLSRYRYTLDVTASGVQADVDLQGVFVAPDRGQITGTIAGVNVEHLIVAGRIYVKDGAGQWIRRTRAELTPVPSSPDQVVTVDTLSANPNPLRGFSTLLQNSRSLVDRGEETLNGVRVRRLDFTIDIDAFFGEDAPRIAERMGEPLPDIGGGTVWIDPNTGNRIHKFTITLDLANFARVATVQGSLLQPTATPGGPPPTPAPPSSLTISMEIRDHNDASVTVDEPPAEPTPEMLPIATATPAPTP
jgi:hypothetical protein